MPPQVKFTDASISMSARPGSTAAASSGQRSHRPTHTRDGYDAACEALAWSLAYLILGLWRWPAAIAGRSWH